MNDRLVTELVAIIQQYQQSFGSKAYVEENNDHDILMQAFGITPELKRENRQYWGRELGMCWQRLVVTVASTLCADFSPAVKEGADEPVDLFIGNDAIDTKYRIGSGDSGTLKKFKVYGKWIQEQHKKPVILILREDNLPAAIQACKVGGWSVKIGDDCFAYLKEKSGFDLKEFLASQTGEFKVERV